MKQLDSISHKYLVTVIALIPPLTAWICYFYTMSLVPFFQAMLELDKKRWCVKVIISHVVLERSDVRAKIPLRVFWWTNKSERENFVLPEAGFCTTGALCSHRQALQAHKGRQKMLVHTFGHISGCTMCSDGWGKSASVGKKKSKNKKREEKPFTVEIIQCGVEFSRDYFWTGKTSEPVLYKKVMQGKMEKCHEWGCGRCVSCRFVSFPPLFPFLTSSSLFQALLLSFFTPFLSRLPEMHMCECSSVGWPKWTSYNTPEYPSTTNCVVCS